jgi:cytoskeletal protein RodZ
MENLGEKLKQARLAKNLSLDEIHKITKINKNYLAALETSNVKAFPAEVYYKNFLKRYASYLGLNGEQILQEYNDSKKQEENKIVNKKTISKQKPAKNKRDFFILIIFAVLILLLILMNYFIKNNAAKTEQEIDSLMNIDSIYFSKEKEKPNVENISNQDENILQTEKQSEQKQENINQSQTQTQSQIQTQTQTVQQIEPVTNEPAVITKTPAQPQQKNTDNKNNVADESEQKLVIKANSDTWVDVFVDGKRKYKGFIFSEQDNIFYAKNIFNVKIGDVNGVEVFFNDNSVDILSGADENNVNTIELKK